MTALQPVNRAVAGRPLVREVIFPACASAMIAASAQMRLPLGLPGHRGLVWLTLLVAVALTTQRRATVLAVGAASTVTALMLHLVPDPGDAVRYLGAAVLLYAVAASGAATQRRWPVVVAAAPIHLVALVVPAAGVLGGGHLLTAAGFPEKVLFHLGFGLVAGVLGWALAVGMDRAAPRSH
jgi:hypothetical protein